MNIALWIVQAILAIKLLTTAMSHGLQQSKPTMAEAIEKRGRSARPLLYTSAVLCLLGAAALILPGLLSLSAWITPIAAALLAVLLLISALLHIRCRTQPKIFVSLVLFVFAAFIAYGRIFLVR
jgi:hypothetical protein